MPTEYRPRPTPCSHCGDTVLVAARTPLVVFGWRLRRRSPDIRLEHADPGPDGEVFDGVDDACTRPPVHRSGR